MNNFDYYNHMRNSNYDYNTPLYQHRPVSALSGLAVDMGGLAIQNMSGLAMKNMNGLAMDLSGGHLGFIDKASPKQMYLGALAMFLGSTVMKKKSHKDMLKYGAIGLAAYTLYQAKKK